MADLVSMDELWDVGSVFRGFFSEPAGSSSDFKEWFEQPSREQHDQGFGLFDDFPEFLETATPVLGDHLVGLVTHSPSEVKENLQFHFQEEGGSSSTVAVTSSSDDTVHAPNKYKRRKNQQKRVVKHVQADDVSSDLWAWRKYGQKPIKGSPFPRSYYRCSSSKGCVARKQVERSSSDPGIFIVTYTGEHSHAHPSRRSSLAGTTRSSTKFPTSSSSLEKKSPKTPTLAEDLGDDHTNSVQLQSVFGSNQTDEKLSCVIPRLVFSDEADEMFMGLDELEMAEWPWI